MASATGEGKNSEEQSMSKQEDASEELKLELESESEGKDDAEGAPANEEEEEAKRKAAKLKKLELRKELHMRERAIARAEDLLGSKVENSVRKMMQDLELDGEHLENAARVFKKLAKQYPAAVGKAVSKKEREDDDLQEQSLVYGEIQFRTFALALEKIKHRYGGLQKPGGVFVDVGSGSGKAVFAALLMHEFSRVVGIEKLAGLHDLAGELHKIWRELRTEPTLAVSPLTRKTEVELVCGDFLSESWADADVAFVNSTCFDKELLDKIAAKAHDMKPNSFLISLTRRIPNDDDWQVLEYERQFMSWGEATFFIHQRKA